MDRAELVGPVAWRDVRSGAGDADGGDRGGGDYGVHAEASADVDGGVAGAAVCDRRVEYVFEASKTRSLPLAAAYHIFGYQIQGGENAPKTMFDHVCKRWGWNTPENVKDGFKTVNEIWRKFEFTPVAVRYTEVPVIDTAALAEPRENDAATA